MPKQTNLQSILIIGAGPIVIGQACEFDYAGTQAVKALKAEGYRIILVNSNPATIMTDPEIADATYIEPITLPILEKIIAKERPDAILPVLGGQTALNATLALHHAGLLKKYQIEIIGVTVKAIELAENRQLFQQLMLEIGLDVPKAITVHNLEEAKSVLNEMPLPLVVRPSFTLGGSGAGIANSQEEFLALASQAFLASPVQKVMIDEALIGWKEFELEVICDKNDNCIIVCGVENLDPLGIHTGDSITVAPIQTLTDKEYQAMREAAFKVLRAIGVRTGGSNVQFAVHPETGRMVVIEMNPRVSRSSALVSKASGFPIAKIAAKLAVGYTLDELKNEITGDQLPASFEPTLDYVVVKIPRFNMEKFPGSKENRGPQMRSVGEVMAIARSFPEALQKAMRSLEINQPGFSQDYRKLDDEALKQVLLTAAPLQLWAIGEAFHRGLSLEDIKTLTHIDPWFLTEIEALIQAEKKVMTISFNQLDAIALRQYKKLGLSDTRLAQLLNVNEEDILQLRRKWAIYPVYKRVDSCAAEFKTPTAYLYSSYDSVCEALPSHKEKMLIIGSGPNRIGQGIEFDYCCVQALKALADAGFETIMLNCNPETVSTDYDVVDRLYCTPLTFEDVLAIIELEKPKAVLLQFGGQTPLGLAADLAKAKVSLLGLDMQIIHQTEDRLAFQQLLHSLNLKQPKNFCVYTVEEGEKLAKEIGFPLIIRPSFVIGGSKMAIVNHDEALKYHLEQAFSVSFEHPVLIEACLQEAIEVDVDAICDGHDVFFPGLLEHIEAAGIHSGDSACIIPPVHLSLDQQNKIKNQAGLIAKHLKLTGVFNIQFAVKGDDIYIIEVNPRASRTLPFLCKATGLHLIEIAIKCMLSESLTKQGIPSQIDLAYYCVKEAVLPFNKFANASSLLGPEMRATGEVMGIGLTADEAYAKAQNAAGNFLPQVGIATLLYTSDHEEEAAKLKTELSELGFTINTTDKDLASSVLIIALSSAFQPNKIIEAASRFAVDYKICHVTTKEAAKALIAAFKFHLHKDYHVEPLKTLYLRNIKKQTKHLLTGEELTACEIEEILAVAKTLKTNRPHHEFSQHLQGLRIALMFDKPSLRTRFSFAIAVQELGGAFIESVSATRKNELPKDQVRVLNGYCHAIMLRTHEDEVLEEMAKFATMPIINGLSNLHHPCQILADILTLQENFTSLKGLTLAYVGDGNNILHSLLLLAPKLGINIHYACPKTRGPNQAIVAKSMANLNEGLSVIKSFATPAEAVKNAHAVYTDVWTSMGFEDQGEDHLFEGYEVNEALMAQAKSNAIFMHCLPMERGKEVSDTLADSPCSVIFQQSENRLHIQKAILLHLLKR